MRGSGWAEDSVPSLAEWGNIGCYVWIWMNVDGLDEAGLFYS